MRPFSYKIDVRHLRAGLVAASLLGSFPLVTRAQADDPNTTLKSPAAGTLMVGAEVVLTAPALRHTTQARIAQVKIEPPLFIGSFMTRKMFSSVRCSPSKPVRALKIAPTVRNLLVTKRKLNRKGCST